MNITGIIAEYNPFHNGHAYQIRRIREQFPHAPVIVMLSGYFCQRGEPALVSPRARASMALAVGADLVLQLPVYASTASAELFAATGTRLLAATGICNNLCFGSESGDLAAAQRLAALLIDSAESIFAHMKELLKAGESYAAARQQAVIELSGSSELGAYLKRPNDILAIEYLKAIKRYRLALQPLMIKRIGCGENSAEFPNPAELSCPSAQAIRALIRDGREQPDFPFNLIDALKPFMPSEALAILLEQLARHKGALLEDFRSVLHVLTARGGFSNTRYLDPEMQARLASQVRAQAAHDLQPEDLIAQIATRQLPLARVRRALISLLLNLPPDIDQIEFAEQGYLHVLGFNRRGRYLLKQMRTKAALPVITSFAKTAALSAVAQKAAAAERAAARIWLAAKTQPLNEFLESPIF